MKTVLGRLLEFFALFKTHGNFDSLLIGFPKLQSSEHNFPIVQVYAPNA